MIELKTQIKTLVFALVCILLPAALIAGIAVADRNTRKTGFIENRAVFDIDETEDAITLSAFDIEVSLDKAAVSAVSEFKAIYDAATPHAVKAGAAFTEMITDSILRMVFQAD